MCNSLLVTTLAMFGGCADTSPIRLVLKSERGIPGFPDYPLLEDLRC
jgi:hypothetical protein